MSYTHLRKDDEAIESFRGAFLKIRKAGRFLAIGAKPLAEWDGRGTI